jgi:uncharacterized protein (DUF305 family)
MRQQLVRLSAAAVVATVTLSACSSSGNQAATSSPSAGTATGSPAPSAAQAHNSGDITFAQNMMPCHKQAIQMSDIILTKLGIDPRVVQVANQIKAAEGPEVQRMQSWLSQWQQPTTPMTPSSAAGMPAMQGMAGMMSPEQMTALQNAVGADASKQFLTMMIQNHQHAVMLAQSEIDSGQYPPAVAMAHSIATSEQQEVNTMQGILG